MDEGLLSLKWNNHKTTFFHVLSNLRKKELYTDATLACEGKFFAIHKLVMSTCSDYFSEVFQKTSCKSPVVILKDIKSKDLECLLDYMYVGEVDVKQTELASLIKAAECLQIKGLAVPDEDPSSIPKKRSHVPDKQSPPSKRSRKESKSYSSRNSSPMGSSSYKPLPSHRTKDDQTSQSQSPRLNKDSDGNTPMDKSSTSFVAVETIKLEEEDLNGDEEAYIEEQNAKSIEKHESSQIPNYADDGYAENSDEIDKQEHDETYDGDEPEPGPSGVQEDNSMMSWGDGDTNFAMYNDETSEQQVCIANMDPELIASRMFQGAINVTVLPARPATAGSNVVEQIPRTSVLPHKKPITAVRSVTAKDHPLPLHDLKCVQTEMCAAIGEIQSTENDVVPLPPDTQEVFRDSQPIAISPKSHSEHNLFKLEYYPAYTYPLSTADSVKTMPVSRGNLITMPVENVSETPMNAVTNPRQPPKTNARTLMAVKSTSTHSCPLCVYQTRSLVDLNKHVRVHTKEKPYKCPACPYETGDKSNFKRHVSRVHKPTTVRLQPSEAGESDGHLKQYEVAQIVDASTHSTTDRVPTNVTYPQNPTDAYHIGPRC